MNGKFYWMWLLWVYSICNTFSLIQIKTKMKFSISTPEIDCNSKSETWALLNWNFHVEYKFHFMLCCCWRSIQKASKLVCSEGIFKASRIRIIPTCLPEHSILEPCAKIIIAQTSHNFKSFRIDKDIREIERKKLCEYKFMTAIESYQKKARKKVFFCFLFRFSYFEFIDTHKLIFSAPKFSSSNIGKHIIT